MFSLLARIPLSLSLPVLAPVLSFYLNRVAGYRKQTVLENLNRCFPDQTEKHFTVQYQTVYRQLAERLFEIARTPALSATELLKRVQVHNPELLQHHMQQGPVLLASQHHNNWEWLLAALRLQGCGDIVPVYQPLHQVSADRALRQLRTRFGAEPVPAAQLGRDLIAHRGAGRSYGLLADQAPAATDRCENVQFFGQPLAFNAGLARLAHITGYPVLFAAMTRHSAGHYKVTLSVLSEAGDSSNLTQRYASACEQTIRDQPEGWLWTHRRWKHHRDQALTRNQSKPES